MAIQEGNLGHFDYMAFYNKDAVITSSALWRWKVPNLNARRAPFVYMSVVSCYVDDSNGTSKALPHFLRCRITSDNYLTFEQPSNTTSTNYITYPIVAMLTGDNTKGGHFYAIAQDNVVIQIPTSVQYLEFDLVDGNGNVITIDSVDGENLNIICKLTYPARLEVTDNIQHTFVQSINPKMTPPSRYTM